jgi:deoxyribodipyrimidine photo-lyase
MSHIPDIRIRLLNSEEVRDTGEFVLYWMNAFRRLHDNYALDRAIDWAKRLKCPLVIFEPLRLRYRWASDRFHRFVFEGMRDNEAIIAKSKCAGVVYYPFIEPKVRDVEKLFALLVKRSKVVVTDDYPCFFLPHVIEAAAKKYSVLFEAIDSNGIIPLRLPEQVFSMAYHFRRWLQKNLRPYLDFEQFPQVDPLAKLKLPSYEMPAEISNRYPSLDFEKKDAAKFIASLPIDHSVAPSPIQGGTLAAHDRLKNFIDRRIAEYGERNEPDSDSASGLSPYLHFGHISAHRIVRECLQKEKWSIDQLAEKATGKNTDWWGTSAATEGFLDELITWREIGFNFSSHRADYAEFESLPDWVQKSLAKHESDVRPKLYTLAEFEAAKTYDPLWNAAQRQLIIEGRIHNYLRMLWGKKILEWSASPREALAIMVELNNKYALDGRDPNSYSGIFWTLGRYDRPWPPERNIFGLIRYMSSDNTAKKIKVKNYLQTYGPNSLGNKPDMLF